jgi:serine/threonine protein kinase
VSTIGSSGERPTEFGSYLLDRKLAQGGMAEVFLARQQGLHGFQKQVVVKCILPALSTDQAFIEMFLNEARLAAQLNHSNVVQVFEAGVIDGRYYIAMEYIEGVDLRLFYQDADATMQPLAPGLACRIVADLLAGLQYAHTRTDEQGRPLGIVHRDVSPQNVLVTRSGNVKVVDFGIAKATRSAVGPQQTQIGTVKGKLSYMSPEQAMGKAVDARSDVFACGILLWELVTGQRLFQRPNDMAIILAISEEPIPTPSSVRRELPAALDRLLDKALARSVHDRYESAQAMSADLELLIRSQNWPGDRRSLERHMHARLPGTTPARGAAALPDPPKPAGPKIDIELGFDDGPTMLAPDAMAPPPARPKQDATPEKPRTPSGMRSMPPTPGPASPSSSGSNIPKQPEKPRTPSGMRSMPPTPGPADYHPRLGRPDAVTMMGAARHRPRRRLFIVITVAVLASAATLFALDWNGSASSGTGAHLVVDVSELASIEIDGHATQVESHAELDVPTGRQLVVHAVTLRHHGVEATRNITLPPATAGERMPIRFDFPKD